jgi:hypothetical protein
MGGQGSTCSWPGKVRGQVHAGPLAARSWLLPGGRPLLVERQPLLPAVALLADDELGLWGLGLREHHAHEVLPQSWDGEVGCGSITHSLSSLSAAGVHRLPPSTPGWCAGQGTL